MINSVDGRHTDIAAVSAFQIPQFFKRYADRIVLVIAIVSVAAIAIIH